MASSENALWMQNPQLANAVRRRQEGAALMRQGTDTSPIQSPWQGVSRLAQALMGGYEARKGDEAITEVGDKRAKMLEGLFAEDMPAQAPAAAVGAALTAPAPQGGAPMPPSSSPDLMGLVAPIAQKYGVPLNIAMALIQQESGGNPNAVGDGGQSVGLGQIQSRTAQQPGYGVPPMDPARRNDPGANVDFALNYLTSKGRALGATDFANPDHVDKALLAYNGGGDPNYVANVRGRMGGGETTPVAAPGGTPQAPAPDPMAEVRRFQSQAQRAAAAGETGLASLFMQRAQMAQQLATQRQPQETEAHRMALQAGLQPGTQEYQQVMRDILAGKARGQSTTINMPSGQAMGTIPPGHIAAPDPAAPGGYRLVRMEGGPDARKDAKEDKKEGMRDAQAVRAADIVVEDIGRIGKAVETSILPATGAFATTLSGVAGTAAHDVSKLLDGIKANVAFDKLQQMREASPTGGALGAVAVEEMKLLQSTLGSLEQSQSSQQFKENLSRLKKVYLDIVHDKGKWREAADGSIELALPTGGFPSDAKTGGSQRPPLSSFAR